MDWITIAAYLSIIFAGLNILLQPVLFGKSREPYSYSSWVATIIINSAITIPVCLRALGYI